jgi:mutator protein MutT
MGRVEHLHVARVGGAPTEARRRIDVAAGVGVRGDRYPAGTGFWRDDRVSRDLTLVEGEVVDELGLAPGETRGVGAVVVRRGHVLLGRRLSAHGRGTWSFPGGKPQPGETPAATAMRELQEETGLVARDGRVVAETIDGFPVSRLLFRTHLVVLDDVRGEPRACEPSSRPASALERRT